MIRSNGSMSVCCAKLVRPFFFSVVLLLCSSVEHNRTSQTGVNCVGMSDNWHSRIQFTFHTDFSTVSIFKKNAIFSLNLSVQLHFSWFSNFSDIFFPPNRYPIQINWNFRFVLFLRRPHFCWSGSIFRRCRDEIEINSLKPLFWAAMTNPITPNHDGTSHCIFVGLKLKWRWTRLKYHRIDRSGRMFRHWIRANMKPLPMWNAMVRAHQNHQLIWCRNWTSKLNQMEWH